MDERFKRIDLKIEKILDTDFRYQLFEMLQEAGIKGTEANSIILNKYKQAIKKFSIARLREMTAIKNDGTVINSNNWWHQGNVPECFKELMPDNAKWSNEDKGQKIL